jgi:predicted Rossmann fold flavoprotein
VAQTYDVIIIGGGAAGLMCAAQAGQWGRRVLLVDHGKKIAEKIRISGGGRCNFTNLDARPAAYLSANPHFCKSALKQYTQHDFVRLVEAHGIAYHEKKLGQLFCDDGAQHIIDMLLAECKKGAVSLRYGLTVSAVSFQDGLYQVTTAEGDFAAPSLVIATGGLSIPKIGASAFGYKVAEQFGVPIIAPRAGLVPLTFQNEMLDFCKALSGVSIDARVSCGGMSFQEGLLFTHRGLSGPSILQISSYWQAGQALVIDLVPEVDLFDALKQRKQEQPKQDLVTALASYLPKRLAEAFSAHEGVSGRLADQPDKMLQKIAAAIKAWRIMPSGTEGYRTAEVTLGGVDTQALSSKTMEVKTQKGLYFIGEVVDVTGHLGGYNFQWAWSSAYVAGQNV